MKNYIGNNNEINKTKYKKSLPPKLNPDAGNVEHNIDMFNKASSGDANLSSAAGMNGMAESYDRDSLIARITEFGKHYNFDKYTDAQLNAMLNRLVDAENHKKRVLPKHQDKINVQSNRHVMNDDPSYNFDDPEREGEYRVENLREALNKLDHYCIDNDKRFHDLRSLYENIAHTLSSQEKTELKNLLNTTNDPDAVKAYLDSKDPDKKQDEELKEDKKGITFEEFMKLADRYYMQGGSEIIEFWDKNSFDEYEKEFGPMSRETAIKLMKTMKTVTDDELEAGRYWGKDTVESYSVKTNSTTDSVDVVDDETNRVVSRHRGEDALDKANHEKDVMNMNEDFDAFDTYSLQDKIYDFLYFLIDDMDYEEMISKVSDEFGMSPDEAEKYVRAYINDSEVEWHDTADIEEVLNESSNAVDRFAQKIINRIKALLQIKYSIKSEPRIDYSVEEFDDLGSLLNIDYIPDAQNKLVSSAFRSIVSDLENRGFRVYDATYPSGDSDVFNIKVEIPLDDSSFVEKNLNESDDGWDKRWSWDDSLYKKDFVIYPQNPDNRSDTDSWHVEQVYANGHTKKHHGNFSSQQAAKDYVDKKVNKKSFKEDYTKADDEWGNPYTLDEVFDQLKELTNDFTDEDGTVLCWYEQEKIYGVKVLKKYYNVVEVSDGRMSNKEDMSWVIAYSDPKAIRKKR